MKQSVNQSDKQSDNQKKNDFSKGSVVGNIMKLAVPMTLAQLINVLYNIVDRIYIGMIPENATLSLTGLGLCLPIISIVIAFANLFGMGGAPLCSIERGRGNEKEAEAIMGNSFVMMVAVGILLTVLGLMFKRPMLYLFGASDATISYADAYVTVYLMGNIFVMTGLGMNSFINSQGFGTVGMMTVLLGAVTNIVLDLFFVVVLHLDVFGVALATVLSQVVSAVLVSISLLRPGSIYSVVPREVRFYREKLAAILRIGVPAGIQSNMYTISNMVLQSRMNLFGTVTVAAWTAFEKIDGFYFMISSAFGVSITTFVSQNFGAQKYQRLRKGVRACLALTFGVTLFISLLYCLGSPILLRLFSSDSEVISLGTHMMWYISPFYFMFVCIEIFSGTARGAGDSLKPMLMTCGGVCVLRVAWVVVVLSNYPALETILVSYPISWGITSLLYLIYYFRGNWLRRGIAKAGFPAEEDRDSTAAK